MPAPFAVVDRRRVDAEGNARFPEPEDPRRCTQEVAGRRCMVTGPHRICAVAYGTGTLTFDPKPRREV